jgi:hypothetical protein
VLGAILVGENKTNVTNALTKIGASKAQAQAVASSLGSHAGPGSAAGQPRAAVHSVQLAFAHSTQTVFYIMAGVMAATFLVALIRLPPGRVQTHEELTAPAASEASAYTAAAGTAPRRRWRRRPRGRRPAVAAAARAPSEGGGR